MKTYKIGTRGSLLAVTQSTLIKNQLEQISGHHFELVLIKTQGDQITDKPLWQLEGKDFFTKELDEALLNEQVDLVIHSYKDLGSDRPSGIKLAAVTERTFAQDILLIPNKNIKALAQWSGEMVVGTSSPRRISNLTYALSHYLPGNPLIKCQTLRGNVNTRIKKLRDGEYHAITLALAGIERLAHTEKSYQELKELLNDINYFVLPQSVFPSAASQGALGIEIKNDRNDGGELLNILSKLSHPKTMEEVSREREAFKNYGGGCHLAIGINVKKINNSQFLHISAGEINGKRIDQKVMEGIKLPTIDPKKKLFIGLPTSSQPDIVCDEFLKKVPETVSLDLTNQHVFVTSRYCLDTLQSSSAPQGLWAAGTKTARELVARGYWVNGTADSLGTHDLKILRDSKALAIMHPNLKSKWCVLTHADSTSDLGDVVGCYTREKKKISLEFELKLKEVAAFYWTSYPQFQTYLEHFPFINKAHHFCGLGKTWQEFSKTKIPITPLASMEDFYQLLRKQ